ncbi:hypothetical protein GIB67_018265, partial [Kingdonia uniflora]
VDEIQSVDLCFSKSTNGARTVSCRKVSMSLRNQEPFNSNLAYGYFLFEATRKTCDFNPFLWTGFKGFHSSSVTCKSVGGHPDVSVHGSTHEEQIGSSADPSSQYGLHAINLGDSGFIVIRDGCTVFQSPVQQHGFNFPHQLENKTNVDLPSSGQILMLCFSLHASFLNLGNAKITTCKQQTNFNCFVLNVNQVFNDPVAPRDVIVTGTDGLFDNLFSNEITTVVVHAIRVGLEPQVVAQTIASIAQKRAEDTHHDTLFSTAAQNAGFQYHGGKLDDITVVVSYISSSCNE